MTKLAALETFKLDVVIQETIDKLNFLDTLKSNMGQEMSEMMSEEISRVMTEQVNLEKKYAMLGQKRATLKGLKNKQKLSDTLGEIKQTAQDLKESTKALCRVLKDNPNINGNQQKIRDDRIELTNLSEEFLVEIKDLSFAKLKSKLKEGLLGMEELDRLRKEEKKLQTEIKEVTTEHRMKQEESAQEFEESRQDIKKLEKKLNDTRTDSDLFIKYLEIEVFGKEDCQLRLFKQEESALEDEIDDLQDRINKENLVSQKIRNFLAEKKETLDKESADWDDKKEKEVERLTNIINEISQKKTEAENKQEAVDADVK